MKRGGGNHTDTRIKDSFSFVNTHTAAGFPPNLFIVVDTHTNYFNGFLQHTGCSRVEYADVGTLLRSYVSDALLDMIKTASARSRATIPEIYTPEGLRPWSDITVASRGGWRCLVVTGNVWIGEHFPYLVQLL